MAKIGYIRVSSLSQDTSRQLDGVDLDITFEEKVSGATAKDRPELQNMLKAVRTGDIVLVHSMDRLARSLLDLLGIVDEVTNKGASIKFVSENLCFSGDQPSPTDQLMLTILGAIGQFERQLIRLRQQEGILKAKERGVYKGKQSKFSESERLDINTRRQNGVSVADIAKSYKTSKATVYRILKVNEI
jgi:DNA invertase Pin-like site-specific DNA recombinase